MNKDVWCTETMKGVDRRQCINKRMTDTRYIILVYTSWVENNTATPTAV